MKKATELYQTFIPNLKLIPKNTTTYISQKGTTLTTTNSYVSKFSYGYKTHKNNSQRVDTYEYKQGGIPPTSPLLPATPPLLQNHRVPLLAPPQLHTDKKISSM